MPKETDADRRLRELARQRAENRIAAKEAAQEQLSCHKENSEQRYADELASEVSTLLPLLVAQNYPGLEEIYASEEVPRRGILGPVIDWLFGPRHSERTITGWTIGEGVPTEPPIGHTPGVETIYLLPDGCVGHGFSDYIDDPHHTCPRNCSMTGTWPPQEIRGSLSWIQHRLDPLLGLRELRRKLEEGALE